ncbi:LEAF RUST 10 DISEASE-RESISTANCE LOCUS RECEPTOR-LIKE PROTEIN KINASE-like 2.5 [Dichanthelium oligosanthes]|uniref:LEAF RUST 10 DISEASE-RESISTANCE LOCUS RECEPTOR-LIKE PROTEIN KINASE-like 2.5 n=1 Tax=Dichanthelium oligosanthes TaxID=888268 RepID=A0A1E5VZH2_9POAL|nr:LEAF RUST 10 DISEASE-RESISTANCE LOCUS RECEPTOR-LIKE PROTEIN KINASE-like 2.5 [Dichanthelium oligosanthes]
MRPALQLLPLLAFLLLQLHHHAHADDCESAACGNLTIRYPFWLGSSNQPWSNCGHPAFKIQCSDDGTVASLKGADTDIHILSINYTDRSFVASQTRVTAGNNGVCRADVNGSTIIGLSVFTISTRNRALCFLYNCNGTEPSGPGYVNATSTCSAPVYAYLAGSMDMSAIEMGGCTLSYVPVREQEPETMSAANYTRLLKDGSTNERNVEALILSYGSLAPKRYRYSKVLIITSSLNNKLGEGGYGTVFKGRLHDGRLVAVKFLHECKGNGEEFVNEVMSIGRTSHINIVSLFGFCLESSKRALIYEYMPNGSLDQYIYSEKPKETLGWQKLYTIAIGIARGLEYLHHCCNTRIVHFDIKPQNILLDQDFCPKIADFGLAKLCLAKESKISMTGARGTIGFIAPEVHSRTFGVVSTKSDVYSYGMMLLEMVGGRKNVNLEVQKSSEKYFPDWIHEHFAQDDGLQVCEVTSEVEEIARKMILIGLWCIQVLPTHRPTMTKVLEMFERGVDTLDMPPKQKFSQILEDSVYNFDTASTTPSSSAKTQGSSEVLKIEEINLVT